MARPRTFTRTRRLSDGTLHHVEKGGEEVPGLSFHKLNRSYYSIDDETGKRVFHGRDVTAAVADFEDDSGFLYTRARIARHIRHPKGRRYPRICSGRRHMLQSTRVRVRSSSSASL